MLDKMGVLSGQIRAHANVELVQNGRALFSLLSVCTAVQWWHVVSHTASRGVLSRSCWASLVRVDLIFDKIDSQFGALGDCIKANNVLGWEPVIRVFSCSLVILLFVPFLGLGAWNVGVRFLTSLSGVALAALDIVTRSDLYNCLGSLEAF